MFSHFLSYALIVLLLRLVGQSEYNWFILNLKLHVFKLSLKGTLQARSASGPSPQRTTEEPWWDSHLYDHSHTIIPLYRGYEMAVCCEKNPIPLSTQGIMLVYDICNEKSFENIKNWIRNIEEVHTSITG